jgi:nucleotide-binding universal stress UspA family protein
LATRGGGLSGAALGSVAMKVVQLADRPVLLVK